MRFRNSLILTIVISLLLGISCDSLEEAGLADHSQAGKVSTSKEDKVAKRGEGRPKKVLSLPRNLPDEYALWVQVKDAVGNPVEEAKITVVFYGESQFGDPLSWGENVSNYSYVSETNHAGNAKIRLPAWQCYAWQANISVAKKDYHGNDQDHLRIDNDDLITFRIWKKSQYEAAKKANG